MHLNVDLIGYLLTCWWSSIALWGERQCSTQSSGPCCTILCTHRNCSQTALCQVLRWACLLPFITSLSVFSLLALLRPQSSAIISSLWKKTFPWVTRCGQVSWYILDRTEYASNMALIIIISTVMSSVISSTRNETPLEEKPGQGVSSAQCLEWCLVNS